MTHHYELTLWPTPAQAARLRRMGLAQRRLERAADQVWALAVQTGTEPAGAGATWAAAMGLPWVLIDDVVAQARAAAIAGRVHPPARQPALTGPGLVTPLAPGWIQVAGVPGPVAASTGDVGQLPRWAREVLGREYVPARPETLAQLVPTLRRAQRADWADIRQERHGWVVELGFVWDDYLPWALSWTDLHDRPHDAELRRLMV